VLGRKDVVLIVIISASFLAALIFFGLMFMGAFYSDDGEVSLGGLGSRVAVVDVFETIIDSEPIVKQLKKWGKSSSVKAIVVHVDSPGGGVAASQEIYEEMLRIREEEKKIVVVSMSSLAASGGYYISCGADRIMANSGTLTGSIGVIVQFYNASKLMEKVGVEISKVKSGEVKDVGAYDRAMTDREREMLTAVIMDTYEQFVETVAKGRNLEKEQIYPLADGSIFTGRQAKELGLVDTLGSFEDAIKYAAELAGISGEPKVVKETKPKAGFLDLLGSTLGGVRELTSGDKSGPQIMYLY
jgi:protease-4